MDKDVETTLASLRSRRLNSMLARDFKDARSKILNLISMNAVVGIGDSTTVRQVGIIEELNKRGTKVLNGFDLKTVYSSIKDYKEHHRKLVKESSICDVFLTGTNAITQDGRLVNVDASGNRVSGMFWGHPMTIIVVGKNKIVKNLNEAFNRLRKVIAPKHIRIRSVDLGGWRPETPCAITGQCNDCRTKDRMCNIFTIIEGKPLRTDINVIIVNDDLGLGWDESWPRERVVKIIENYKRFVWVPSARIVSCAHKKT